MRNLILMALDKAERLTDEELAEEIAQLESGTRKLQQPDERDIILPVLRRVQEHRNK